MNIRVGIGYDVHQLAPGEELWIGGILVPSELGAVGYSDADVLIHAIIDALFGAAAMGDIGTHFPDTDPQWKGVDSKLLLKHCRDILEKQGYAIGNIDSTICLQRPKMKPHIPQMIKTIAEILVINPDQVSVKATTTEKLGFVGKEKGIAAYATALIYKPS